MFLIHIAICTFLHLNKQLESPFVCLQIILFENETL